MCMVLETSCCSSRQGCEAVVRGAEHPTCHETLTRARISYNKYHSLAQCLRCLQVQVRLLNDNKLLCVRSDDEQLV